MELINKYFTELTELQRERLEMLKPLYTEWNEKINTISRKDIENLYERHILHALGLLKLLQFEPGSDILDLGTGGGIPGIPLAIMMPDVQFRLIDGRGKKITVVNEIAAALDLKNVKGEQKRAEELKGAKFDFVVARGVTTIDKLTIWSRRLMKDDHINQVPNGLLAYKGGDLSKEKKLLPKHEYYEVHDMKDWFEEPFFEEKHIMYVQG
jgi:16S rRNA (guanine527-N7)-methyltransferase